MVEKVFHDITGRKFSDLKSRYTKKRATLGTIFTNMIAENTRLDCNVYKKTYEFE